MPCLTRSSSVLKERIELLLTHPALAKALTDGRENLAKSLLRKNLGFNQHAEIFFGALAFASAQFFNCLFRSRRQAGDLDYFGLGAHI